VGRLLAVYDGIGQAPVRGMLAGGPRHRHNALLAVAYLHGLTLDELRPEDLEKHDDDYQLVITVRAVKPHMQEEARS
jgi:hypothetical protein